MIASELRQLARAEGFALQPIKTRAPYLQGYGFSPATVIDVGVHDGTPWLYRSFPDAEFVLVDPQAGSADVARELGATFHQVALGEASGAAVLNVPETEPGKGGAMASLLPRTDKLATRFTSIEEVDVQVTTLDALTDGLKGPFGLKIDTEGFEAPILAGGPNTLQSCEFVILELSVSKRFDGVAPPSQAISLLADAGLEFRDVLAMASGPGKKAKPRHMDVLFARWMS